MSDDAGYSFLGIDDRRWALYASLITVVGLGTAIAAAGWAIYEYRQEQEARRIEYTLSVIDSWEEHGYRLAYGKLRRAHAAFIDGISAAELELAAQSDTAKANIMRNFTRMVGADPQIAENVREVMYFFNRLALCINAGICTTSTSRHFFDDTVSTFLEAYGPYIEQHRDDFPGSSQTVFDLSAMLNASP